MPSIRLILYTLPINYPSERAKHMFYWDVHNSGGTVVSYLILNSWGVFVLFQAFQDMCPVISTEILVEPTGCGMSS